jgi:hypothetical protein
MAKFIRLPLVHRSIRLVYLFVLSLILVGSIGAYAASVTINTANNAGYQGEYVVDNGYFTASAISYNVVEAPQAASAGGLAWSNGGTAYVNALVAGDWEVAWTITIQTGALTSHLYTFTVTSTAASGITSTLYTFQFTSPATITAGQTMTILWDTGAVTWTAPAAVQITVA